MKAVRVAVGVLCTFLMFTRGWAVPVSGRIQDGGNVVAAARLTLFTPDLRIFREQRSDSQGNFSFSYVAEGNYRLGVAALNYEYQERSVTVSRTPVTNNFSLGAETNGGRWTVVGDTEPELLGGSGSGSLLPSGEVFFCHDTEEPIVFDPVSGMKWYPPDSGSGQGCHITTLNTVGAPVFCGRFDGRQPTGSSGQDG